MKWKSTDARIITNRSICFYLRFDLSEMYVTIVVNCLCLGNHFHTAAT